MDIVISLLTLIFFWWIIWASGNNEGFFRAIVVLFLGMIVIGVYRIVAGLSKEKK